MLFGGVAVLTGSLWIGYPIAVLPAIMLLLAGLYHPGALGTTLFANRAAVFLGEISYSLYLVHGILKALYDEAYRRAGLQLPGLALLGFEIALTIMVAWVVHRYIEAPCRRRIVQAFTDRKIKTVKEDVGEAAPDALLSIRSR
jgi:peptidoglycan/LPS O-acetylase OafA/YrhL